MEDKLSKYITSFWKDHGTQRPLITMLEKWENVLEKKNMIAAYLYISQKPLMQLISIFCWQN